MALTEEQKLRIEENRLKALARRQESQRASGSAPTPSSSATTASSSTFPGQIQGPRPRPPPVVQNTSTSFQGSFLYNNKGVVHK